MRFNFDKYTGFQWDDGNLDKNLTKHKVENWEAEQIFFNRPVVTDDLKHSQSERRWAAYGETDSGRLLVVVFTERGKLIRIISARDMNQRERTYYGKKSKANT